VFVWSDSVGSLEALAVGSTEYSSVEDELPGFHWQLQLSSRKISATKKELRFMEFTPKTFARNITASLTNCK
jgi:hypothetical protein